MMVLTQTGSNSKRPEKRHRRFRMSWSRERFGAYIYYKYIFASFQIIIAQDAPFLQ